MAALWCGISAVLAIGWISTTTVLLAKLKEEKEKEKIINKIRDLTNPENLFEIINNKEAH